MRDNLMHSFNRLQIPIIWDDFIDEAADERETDEANYKAALDIYKQVTQEWEARNAPSKTKKKLGPRGPARDPRPKAPVRPKPRMHADEVPMFLNLSCAAKILLGRSLHEEYLQQGEIYLKTYLRMYLEVFKPRFSR
jgi:hypothetical protein